MLAILLKKLESDFLSRYQQAWDFLKTALDEDRLSNRPLFP